MEYSNENIKIEEQNNHGILLVSRIFRESIAKGANLSNKRSY